MQKNIINISLIKTQHYLTTIRYKQSLANIITKYIRLHNKGVFVNFNFNSCDASGLFGHYTRRYGVESLVTEHVNEKFSRQKIVELSDLSSTMDKNKRNLESEKSFWDNYQYQIKTFSSNYPKNDESELYENSLDMLHTTIRTNINSINLKKNMFTRNKKLISAIQINIRNLSKVLNDMEIEIFKLTLNRYVQSLEHYFSELFRTKNLYVQFDKKELLKNFNQRETNEAYMDESELFYEYELSYFESSIFNFLIKHSMDFKLVLNEKSVEYKIFKNGEFGISKAKTIPYPTHQDLNTLLEEFSKKNPSLVLLICALNAIPNDSPVREKLQKDILSFIQRNFPPALLSEYDNLYNFCLTEKEQRQLIWDNQFKWEKEPLDFKSSFPSASFVTTKIKDWKYFYALKENRFLDVISSISNDELIIVYH